MELEGKLLVKFDEQTVGAKGFRKREFVVEYAENPQYPQKIKLEFSQDKCAELDKYNEGDMVKVLFNLRGSEWQGKYFVNLSAWRIELASSAGEEGKNSVADTLPVSDANDDLPF